MKIPSDAVIPHEKITAYLLVWKAKNDKSKFLAQAGFTQDNPDDLEAAIRQLIRENEAEQDREDEYGTFYRVTGTLTGPEGELAVVTVWIFGTKDQQYRFITLKPDKE